MRQMLHGTAISIGGHGVLIMGESGSGKSDLALRLIDRGAILISDDVVFLETRDNAPILTVAPNIVGKIEVRGVGIFDVSHLGTAQIVGPGAVAAIDAVLTTSLDRIGPGQAQYTCGCAAHG